MRPLFIQWGGGNIGRSFIGQVFATSGYHVLFIDIDRRLVEALNSQKMYTVESVSSQGVEKILVEHVSAVPATDQEAINDAVIRAELMGVSVGRRAWPLIAPSLAQSVLKRYETSPSNPLDIILAENIHGARQYVSSLLKTYLPGNFPLDTYVGLVETSIGKMVPLQDADDSLTLRAEPYNELIVNREAFHGIPAVKGLSPVHPIEAYVDRKLFIHNLGHAVTAYLGYHKHPEETYIAKVLDDDELYGQVRETMLEAAEVLIHTYPAVFSYASLSEHIDDLLYRFQNPVLKDTVYRVGRDLKRKLRFDDRLMGVIIHAQKHGLTWKRVGTAYLAAITFDAVGPAGECLESDRIFIESTRGNSLTEKLLVASDWEHSGYDASLFEQIAGGFLALERDSQVLAHRST